MNDSSLRLKFSRENLFKSLMMIAFITSLTACNKLANKQNSSPEMNDPSKPNPTVALPPPDDDQNAPVPVPTPPPIPTPKPTKKPCRHWVEQDGQYYEEQDDGQWTVFEVPQFYSAQEEADFWAGKGGDCSKPTPTPAPTPVPPPVATVKPSFYCKPDANGNFSFDTIMTGGSDPNPATSGYVFGQGGGCINRPLREVWAVALNQPLMIWNGVGGTGFTIPSPLGVAKAYDVHYTVTRKYLGVPFTVTWEMNWYHSVQKGTAQDPEKILINYHRYHGTTHIGYWEGSILLQKVTDQITGVYIRNQINADQTGVDGATGGASDVLEKFRTGAPDLTQLP